MIMIEPFQNGRVFFILGVGSRRFDEESKSPKVQKSNLARVLSAASLVLKRSLARVTLRLTLALEKCLKEARLVPSVIIKI